MAKASRIGEDRIEVVEGFTGYIAPEVFKENASYDSDIFSVGVLLYRMVLGKDLMLPSEEISFYEIN